VRDEALALLDSLTGEQRAAIALPDDRRRAWFYTPNDHGGLPLSAMTPAQHDLVFRLLAAALAPAAYATACTIIGLENVLAREESFRGGGFAGRDRLRDPGLYWVAVFGDPASGDWAWRIGGHHLSIHRTFAGGELAAATPSFFGADPADTRLLGGGWLRPLAAYEDLGRALVHAHPDAVVTGDAPPDLASGNRPALSEGDAPMPPFRLMQLGEDDPPAVDPAIPLTRAPRGVASPDLQPLLDAYAEQVPGLSLAAGGFRFLWAGGVERGEPHYYRLQSDDWLIEYDNTQRDVNHIHTVLRHWTNDFGADVLAEHHAAHH